MNTLLLLFWIAEPVMYAKTADELEALCKATCSEPGILCDVGIALRLKGSEHQIPLPVP